MPWFVLSSQVKSCLSTIIDEPFLYRRILPLNMSLGSISLMSLPLPFETRILIPVLLVFCLVLVLSGDGDGDGDGGGMEEMEGKGVVWIVFLLLGWGGWV